MGIPGLLQFIKDASEPITVRKYKGQTVAVDTYCWLHKGAFACAEKLAKGEPTDQYVTYCMKFVDMLLSFGVKPILVFDGCNLPSKEEVNKARRERRQANLQKGKQLLREGKLSEARDCFTRCINVTPAMAHDVIKAARTRGVDCVVAPYEADAQLAFLNKAGVAQAIITEDSDLLAFGCKKVILKMDKQGNGLEIDQSHLGRCRSLGDIFTEEKFRHMCILSGCDYLASLYGIGLGKACKLLRMANNPDILKVIKKMGQYLKMSLTVPDEYLEGFVKADNTFLYQLVFDPLSRKVVPLNPYPPHIDPAQLSYAGINVGDRKGLQMALGNVHIYTMEKIDDFNPDSAAQPVVKPCRSRGWSDSQDSRSRVSSVPCSIWSRGYVPGGLAPAPASPQRPPPTRGKERVVSVQGLKLPCREPQAKRPREDCGVSEEDMLLQYSSSGMKRHRAESSPPAEPPVTMETWVRAPASQPRNRFATLLQRRNQGEEGVEQGTRSRFFSSSSSSVHAVESQDSSPVTPPPSQPAAEADADMITEGQEVRLVEPSSPAPSLPPSPSPSPSPPPRPASQGLGVFSWSGSTAERLKTPHNPAPPSLGAADGPRTPAAPPGLSALQHFHRKKETFSWGAYGRSSQPQDPAPTEEEEEGREASSPDSPPSQDSAYFSQPNSTCCSLEDTPSLARLLHTSPSTEVDAPRGSDCSDSPAGSPVSEVRPAPMRTKVSGLPRVRPGDPVKVGKIRPSGPARASGLRKKPAGTGKKSSSFNNENQPGLQATISGLWKNFGFKKENVKMSLCKKGEPMSPVKDNVLSLQAESDNDITCLI